MGLIYAVAVQSTISVWPPGMEPLPPKPWSGRGRKPSRTRRDADHLPVSAKALATTLPKEAWRDVSWREGSNQTPTDLRHLRPGRRAQIVEMIGSGLENLRKRSATEIHILLTFPQFVPIL